jgi:hypothetical protein
MYSNVLNNNAYVAYAKLNTCIGNIRGIELALTLRGISCQEGSIE